MCPLRAPESVAPDAVCPARSGVASMLRTEPARNRTALARTLGRGRVLPPYAGGTLSEIRAELKGRVRSCILRNVPVGAESCQAILHVRNDFHIGSTGSPCAGRDGLIAGLCCGDAFQQFRRRYGGLFTGFAAFRSEKVQVCAVLMSCCVDMLHGVVWFSGGFKRFRRERIGRAAPGVSLAVVAYFYICSRMGCRAHWEPGCCRARNFRLILCQRCNEVGR